MERPTYQELMAERDALRLNCALIDKSVIWYGGINFLGYHVASDNVMTFRDPETANRLLEVLWNGQM